MARNKPRILGTMPTFTHEGFNLAYEERGPNGAKSRPIVLLHGLLLPRKQQYALGDVLAARGNRVILMDLLGHGDSDKPSDARLYRMELFAAQALALVDHLGLEQAVLGGTSLGANVAVEAALRSQERVRGLFVEMPVLERAAMAAGVIFLPVTVALRRLERPGRSLARLFEHLPRTGRPAGVGLYADLLLDLSSRDPAPSGAVLRGLLSGELAPHPSRRRELHLPALIVGHRRDPLHPFSDAEELHRELPNSKLVEARSFFELRFPPNRLSNTVADFLDTVWA